MKRRAFLVSSAGLLATACAPLVQQAGKPDLTFSGPRLETDALVSFDGARLPLKRWLPEGEPRAVIVGLHGMNDYANSYHLAAPWWAQRGVATYAFDQRGFGGAPGRGIWGGQELMCEDLRTCVALVRMRHPGVTVVVAGESMGGGVAIAAFASDRPPAADRLVLLAPAVWGWSSQPLPNKTLLWITAHVTPGYVVEPPEFVIRNVRPTDNRDEMIAMGQDKQMIWGARPDTIYGLVNMMEHAWRSIGAVQVPTAYLYGAHDDVIPKPPSFDAAARMGPNGVAGYYDKGYHLLLRDMQREVVYADVLSFIDSPRTPLPSGVPKLPSPKRLKA